MHKRESEFWHLCVFGVCVCMMGAKPYFQLEKEKREQKNEISGSVARLCETRNMRRKHKSRMDCCHVSTFGFGFVCNNHCRKTYRCGGKLTSDSCCIGGFTVPMWFTDTVLTCVYAKTKKRKSD